MQAVGILYADEITQVAKAWYAVGIGNGLASTQNHEMQTKLNIYPNPVSGNKVFIDSSLEEATAVEMFDMTRKQVAPKTLDYKTTIYVSACKTGIYIF
ncbi:MAG: T9SS type A sorting domain-containing protein [Myroides sp.]|nr:T9SS type A sorting domain-containing protein [Myroides sp.]